MINIKFQPPCNVEIKLTLSLLFRTVFSLSSISQSTSLIKQRIPGFNYSLSTNNSGFYFRYFVFKMMISCSTVNESFSISRFISLFFSKSSSNPPLKSTYIFILMFIIFNIIEIDYIFN